MLSVFYSVLDLIADNSASIFSNIYGVNFLRYFRFLRILLVLRILKFCIKLEYMSYIFCVIKKSLYKFVVIIGIFFLVISFYALIGRTVLNPYYEKNSIHYFKTFGDSFITSFIIITMDNWYLILTQGVEDPQSLILISSYVVSILLIGNFIFLNLFLTVLIDAFESESQLLKQQFIEVVEDPVNQKDLTVENFLRGMDDESPRRKRVGLNETNILTQFAEINNEKRNSLFGGYLQELTKNKSLFCFATDDPFRMYMMRMAFHPYFKKLSRIFILLQIILTIYNSFEESLFLEIMKLLIYIFFTIEAFIKIISKGLFLNIGSYLRSFSNMINFCATLSFYFSFYYAKKSMSLDLIFTIFQAMVPLRLFETNKKLKKIVLSLWQSLDEIANVILALLIVW